MRRLLAIVLATPRTVATQRPSPRGGVTAPRNASDSRTRGRLDKRRDSRNWPANFKTWSSPRPAKQAEQTRAAECSGNKPQSSDGARPGGRPVATKVWIDPGAPSPHRRRGRRPGIETGGPAMLQHGAGNC